MMEKQLVRFKELIERGRYLFHVHTDWTDGTSSLPEYCEAAKRLGFQSLIVVEHIRKEASYDFTAFLNLVERQRSIQNLEIAVGVEAKVLEDGKVDMPDTINSCIEVLAIAEHAFKGDADTLAEALCQAFKHYSKSGIPCVWVHPGLKLVRSFNAERAFKEVLQTALSNGVRIEYNLRHDLPPDWALSEVPRSSIVIGLDAHSVEEVERLTKVVLDQEMALKR